MIGTLRETELHATLKRHYARSGDRLEAEVDGYVVDIVRDDELVEIQTHNFAALKRKLNRLLERHAVRLVYPIAQAKWITRVQADQRTLIGRRKSPHRGALEDVFLELVSLPELITHPRFILEVVLVHEEEIRCPRSSKRCQRDWRVCNRRLLGVLESVAFAGPNDFRRFIPSDLSVPFTSYALAAALHRPDYFAHKMTYCLRKMGVLTIVGKRQRAWLYTLGGSDPC
jgi:hypothetical protein